MFGMIFTPSPAYSSHGRPGFHASSHTEMPMADDASRTGQPAWPATKYLCSSKTP